MTAQIVFKNGDQVVTTSRLVAEKFEKDHSKVLRAIRELGCSVKFTEANFGLSEYTDSTGRKLPEYIITKDGFSFLVMGFTGGQAAKFKEDFINAFNKMEGALKPKTPLESSAALLKVLVYHQEEMERQNAKLTAHETQLSQLQQWVQNFEITKEGEPFYTIMGYAALRHKPVNIQLAAKLGKLASPRCKDLGIELGRIKDPRFGMINTYPESVLSELFDEYFQPEYKAA